jgi:predicted helicase
VLVPTLLLLKQFRREWREAAQLPFVDLAVCSDADTVEPDKWRVRADEVGVPVSTDPTTMGATPGDGSGRARGNRGRPGHRPGCAPPARGG